MKKFYRSKHFYNSKLLIDDKCYLIFVLFNIDLSIINVLRLNLENDLGLKISKIKTNLNTFQIYFEINFKNYLEDKEDLIEFFSKEDFKFLLSSIFYKNNYMLPSFFESEFLQDFEELEVSSEILYFIYLKILYNEVEKRKIIFFFYNIFFLNKNLISFNVYNTSSSI